MKDTNLPDGWIELPIEKLAQITTGSRDTKDREENGEYPFFVRSQTVERINSVGFDGEGVLTAGDGVGTGKIFHYINGKCDFHQRVYLVHSFSPAISGRYFYFYFRSFFYDRIMSMTAKSSVDSVRREMIADMLVRLPENPREQNRIVEALSDADALIEGLERLIAKKRLIKQGAMQDLLTAKRRLPGFSGEWEKTPLGDIGPFVGGGTPSMAREDFWKDGTVPWVSSSDVRIGELHGAERLITNAAVKGSSTRVVEHGSILFVTRSGILRRFQPVMINSVPVAINQDIKALLPRSSAYSPRYVFHAAVASGDQILRDCMKTGTTVESIDLNALRRFQINCPQDQAEQDAIAAALTDMDAEIQALETRLEKARQVKEGMMQNLLTGRIRLV
ncbi:type I restriction enzyme S subunit [Primorskyibacter sedentarius]|uniref:Type I restriction enzyme S subunit n=1 Tax=Primorskyibacter sedentarius TaxID=745311 RepID=A0A4R3J2D3_9RHOB|nr:restriction endonuclease subunit S [Primorskyibacter sedentarius]TCS58963.1 type I restriction enzyme S subunit [Primorskyibacter sedentarius]